MQRTEILKSVRRREGFIALYCLEYFGALHLEESLSILGSTNILVRCTWHRILKIYPDPQLKVPDQHKGKIRKAFAPKIPTSVK